MAALAVVILVSIWLAFAVLIDTGVEIDEDSGTIRIRGVESKFIGYATGSFNGMTIIIEGYPDAADVKKFPRAWRALCAVRDDPETDWTNTDDRLRADLHSERINDLCRPFEAFSAGV